MEKTDLIRNEMIKIFFKKRRDLTVVQCSGRLTEEEVRGIIQTLYENPTKNTKWDLSDALMEGISPEFIRWAEGHVRKLGVSRQGGKTAFIAPKDLEYGLARMFQIMCDKKGFPFKVGVFRSYDKADNWLLEKDGGSAGLH